MQPDARKLLLDIEQAARGILQFAQGRTLARLQDDDLFRSAVYWKFVVIGEAISQLRRIDEPAFDSITEAPRIVGFRNQIIHGYAVVEDAITWDIVQRKVPILVADVQRLLAS